MNERPEQTTSTSAAQQRADELAAVAAIHGYDLADLLAAEVAPRRRRTPARAVEEWGPTPVA